MFQYNTVQEKKKQHSIGKSEHFRKGSVREPVGSPAQGVVIKTEVIRTMAGLGILKHNTVTVVSLAVVSSQTSDFSAFVHFRIGSLLFNRTELPDSTAFRTAKEFRVRSKASLLPALFQADAHFLRILPRAAAQAHR